MQVALGFVPTEKRLVDEVPILVGKYQRLFNEYQSLIDEYQRLVGEYQSLIDEYQRLDDKPPIPTSKE